MAAASPGTAGIGDRLPDDELIDILRARIREAMEDIRSGFEGRK